MVEEWYTVEKKHNKKIHVDADLRITENTRSEALESFTDRHQIHNNRSCTRLCNSVGTGMPCRHGSKCNFAHSTDELVIGKCFFGSMCRYVKQQVNGVYLSVGKDCINIHPGESEDSFYTRTKLPRPLSKSKKVLTPKIISMPTVSEAYGKCSETVQNNTMFKTPVKTSSNIRIPEAPKKVIQKSIIDSNTKNIARSLDFENIDNTIDNQVKSVNTETVLRVPREFALQAMDIAIKAGNTKIRIEII